MISRIKRVVVPRIMSRLERFVDKHRVHVCNVRGQVILVQADSDIERFRADTYATKEPETLEWIERYFRPGDVVYDIGANIGLYSLFAAKHLGGDCTVYAFEPEALNHARLSKNIHLNGLSGVVYPCCVAITDELCFDRFYLNPENFENLAPGQGLVPGSALHNFGAPVDYTGTSFQPVHLQVAVGVPIDYLWQEWGREFPNHLKIDVDGLEDKVIEGARQTLNDRRLKSVLVEVSSNGGTAERVLPSLARAGLVQVTDFVSHSSELLEGSPYEDCVNYVFIRASGDELDDTGG